MKSLSIIVPSFNEKLNIVPLAEKIFECLNEKIQYEVIVVDDNSPDGTAAAVNALELKYCFKVIERKDERGLSSAVIRGFQEAKYPLLLCMDADLSHPAEAISKMVEVLSDDVDMVVGSRYVKGGSTYNWTFFRWINSQVATLLALPLVKIKDPMAGFFLLRKELFNNADNLSPLGYKILLEIIVKAHAKKVVEVPISFQNRVYGESKLSLSEQAKYLIHVKRLYSYKFFSFFRRK